MMGLLRVLRSELAKSKMTFADIMPVAGIDKGTLENRFDTDFSRGSVVGKTGTLGNTDGGVSALAGEINTRSGRLLFVVFNQRGKRRSLSGISEFLCFAYPGPVRRSRSDKLQSYAVGCAACPLPRHLRGCSFRTQLGVGPKN